VTWLLDLDGVVWLADEPIAGAADAVARLRASGERVAVATNNSFVPVADYLAKLERHGIPTDRADLVTSADALATLIEPGETVLVIGGAGIIEAVTGRGATVVEKGPADAVAVGWNRAFDFDLLTTAMSAVRGGARLLASNDDATYPTPNGLLPGGGSILAAVAYASGVTPVVAGKPNAPMVETVRARLGPIEIMVGDRPDTDGLLARGLGAKFALVLTGVTTHSDLPVEPTPDHIADSLADLVDRFVSPSSG
jgi:HAD superfamily hydrolase (TIGR01450 family)